ncbi:MAG TPA: chemotaxis protein CheX [Polyangiaceae bacterium]|nr:chemotaxis protein CheX [Polyangiaceae bacterium]
MKTSVNSALDTIVQSATVELFHSQGIALGPIPRTQSTAMKLRQAGLIGLINFTSPSMSGSLGLALSADVLSSAPDGPKQEHAVRDWLRESTNQLMGRIKNRCLQFQVTLQAGLPSIVNGEALLRQSPRNETELLYMFRALRGEVSVSLRGRLDTKSLVYSGSVSVASEGELILF